MPTKKKNAKPSFFFLSDGGAAGFALYLRPSLPARRDGAHAHHGRAVAMGGLGVAGESARWAKTLPFFEKTNPSHPPTSSTP